MTATNHALTGTAIGLIVGQPLLALPLALLSHYICDAIPHFGTGLPDTVVLKTKAFRTYLLVEAAICFGVVLALALLQPAHWELAAVCAFVAAAPDLLSINHFATIRRGKKWKSGWYTSFASKIQWFERPIGAVVEVVWLIGLIWLIAPFVKN